MRISSALCFAELFLRGAMSPSQGKSRAVCLLCHRVRRGDRRISCSGGQGQFNWAVPKTFSCGPCKSRVALGGAVLIEVGAWVRIADASSVAAADAPED